MCSSPCPAAVWACAPPAAAPTPVTAYLTSVFSYLGPTWESDGATLDLFLKKARKAVALARESARRSVATPQEAFPMVIDYALAKGLAHEAFGHAAEADGFRSSILARDGRFLSGDSPSEPITSRSLTNPSPRDHAWQPYSSNGIVRERATLVDHGRLSDGLSDLWSAKRQAVCG